MLLMTGMMTIISPSQNTDNVGRQYFPRCYWWQRCSISPTWCCLYPCLSQVQDSSILIIVTLEPVCRKIAVTQQLFCCPLKVLNCTKLVLDDLGNNSFNISLESFRSFRAVPYSTNYLTNKQTNKLKTKEFEEKTEFIVRLTRERKKKNCGI